MHVLGRRKELNLVKLSLTKYAQFYLLSQQPLQEDITKLVFISIWKKILLEITQVVNSRTSL